MSSNTAQPVPPTSRKTRPSNPTKRLGLPDLPAKKRTSAEKRADEKIVADQQAAKAIKTKDAIKQMGMLEQKMETDQAAALAPVKPVRPHPKLFKKKGTVGIEDGKPASAKGKVHLMIDIQE